MEEEQYDLISGDYSDLAKVDPSKQYTQYPGALKYLGDLEGKMVLDVGCGDGIFTRMMARRGARVVGYDSSEEQISLARKEEKENPLGIEYFVAKPSNIEEVLGGGISFDLAVSTLVLLYSKDRTELREFFASSARLLREGGRFVSVTFNPEYKRLDEPHYNRIFSTEERGMRVDFLNKDESIRCSAKFTNLSKEDYETTVGELGLTLEWKPLKVYSEGVRKVGKNFWEGYENDCPYVGLIVK